MGLFITSLVLLGFCVVMLDLFRRLPSDQAPKARRWFRSWAFRGLIVPFVLWVVFNSATWSWLPPLMPEMLDAQSKGQWPAMMEHVAALGLFVIGTYWAGATLAWVLTALHRQAADRRQFRRCVLQWSIFLAPLALLIIASFGWRLAGLGVTLWLLPILQQILALQPEERIPPVYSRALAAIHSDKFEEAEKAVIKELETCEDDFDGWLLLAELYAVHFHDLTGARKIIRETCDAPGTTSSQIAVAFHRLADWHLKIGQDPDAARSALEDICRRFAGSHLDRMARLRIEQLPPTREAWIAGQEVKKVRLTTLRGSLSDAADANRPARSAQEAFALSQQCVARLTTNPDDVPSREELARVWAEDLNQVQMGIEQLEMLLAMPGASAAKAAEWLGLAASWHLQPPQNLPAARAAMERLVREYPRSAQAFAAQRRLNLMALEARIRQATAARQEVR